MDIAIDMGCERTRVFVPNKGKVLDESSVVTHDIDTEEIFAVGNEAYNTIGKTPFGIEAVHPLEKGVIAHSELAEDMISIFMKELCPVKVSMPRVVASIPCNITEVEKRAIVNAVASFGVKRVFLIESPKAAALGCGIDVTSPHGVLIVDAGGSTCEIAVISLGGISVSRSIKRAGSDIDEEIIKFVRKKYGLIIGKNMAERCKVEIGCVKETENENLFRLKGRDAVSGLPRFVDITSTEIIEAILEIAMNITTAIKDVLEETPPELSGDIYSDGIVLTGGMARLQGFAKLISEVTKLKVRVHKEPADCVINGCAKAIDYIPITEKNPDNGISPITAAF